MSKRKKIDQLRLSWKSCSDCSLSLQRSNVVFYRGNPESRFVIIGEAPGRDEDEQGKPFVGSAGRTLDSLLAQSRLDVDDDIFVMNILGCRPPNNRTPKREEIKACEPRTNYLIKVVDPKVILLLGATAAKLACITSIGPWRGTRVEVDLEGKTYPAVVTYHPSFLLRQGGSAKIKRKILFDIALAKSIFKEKG